MNTKLITYLIIFAFIFTSFIITQPPAKALATYSVKLWKNGVTDYINEDGSVHNTGATQHKDYTNTNTFYISDLVEGGKEDNMAYVEFNTSIIPDSAQITSVTFWFNRSTGTQHHNANGETRIWNCDCRPSISTAGDIFSNVTTKFVTLQTLYEGTLGEVNVTNANWTVSGGVNPANSIEALLPNNWFAFYLEPVHIGKTNSESHTFWSEESGNSSPILYITYTVDAPEISNPSPSNGAVDVPNYPFTCADIVHPTGKTFDVIFELWNGTAWNFYDQNLTVSNGTYCANFTNATYPDTFYWRVRANDSAGNETIGPTWFFTTIGIQPPTGIGCSKVNNDTALNISFTKAPGSIGATVYTLCYYQEGYVPPAWGEGTFGFNTTGTGHNVTGLTDGSCYSFSLWSNQNDAGVWTQSSTRGFVSPCCTGGGRYRINFRYENESYNATLDTYYNNYINFTKYPCSNHTLIVHYENGYNDYYQINQPWYVNNGNHSYIDINVTTEPLYFEFYWNSSVDMDCAKCNLTAQYSRKLTPYSADANDNITFYMITNRHVFNEYYFHNVNGSHDPHNCTEFLETELKNNLIPFDFNFDDRTHLFTNLNLDGRATFYAFNTTQKIIVHEEYLDTQQQVHPVLIFAKKYFVGMNCTDTEGKYYENIGFAPNNQWVYPYDARTIIINPRPISYIDYSKITTNYGWISGAEGFWYYYYDTTLQTTNVTVTIFNASGSQVYKLIKLNTQEWNFTYPTANHSFQYKVNLSITQTITVNGSTSVVTSLVSFWVKYGESYLTNAATINATLSLIFGQLPHNTYAPGITYWMDYNNIIVTILFIFVFGIITSYVGIGAGAIAGGISIIGYSGFVSGLLSPLPYLGMFIIFIGILIMFAGDRLI